MTIRFDDGSFASHAFVEVLEDAQRTDGESDEIEVVASTERLASDGDIIEATSWQLAFFRGLAGRNLGPVLSGHRASHASMIGVARVKVDKDARVLRAWYRHLEEGTSEAVDIARRLRAQGVRAPVSVRWRPGKVTRADQLPADHPMYRAKPIKIATPWGEIEHMPRVHERCTLLEVSEVVIPADRGAGPVRAAGGPGLASMIRSGDPETIEALSAWLRDRLGDPEIRDVLADLIHAERLAAPRSIDDQVWGG